MNPRVVIAVYRPHPGKEKELERVVSKHYSILARQKLVTRRLPIVMRAKDNTIVEVFEWLSSEAIAAAHSNREVLALWDEFNEVCTYDTPVTVEEFHNLFSEFEPLDFP